MLNIFAFNEANAPTMPFTLLLKETYIDGLNIEDQKLINRKTNEEFSVQKHGKYRHFDVFDGLEIKRGAKKNND